jgi:hypothetical protein
MQQTHIIRDKTLLVSYLTLSYSCREITLLVSYLTLRFFLNMKNPSNACVL